jgi:hypothetical protein
MNKIQTICLLFLFASLVSTHEITKNLDDLKNCLNHESVKELTGLVYDLYAHKFSLTEFVNTYISNSSYSEAFMCMKTHGGDLWKVLFRENSLLVKVGFTLLYESNCSKDVGVVMLLAEKVLSDIKDISKQWKELIGVSIMSGLATWQGYSDCKSAFEQIRDIWSH